MKIRHLFVTILITSLFLTGCAGSKDSSAETAESDGNEASIELEKETGDVSLRVWGAEEDAELLRTIADNFISKNKSEANITIQIEAMSESNCRDGVLDDVNNAPDVFTFADDQLSGLAASGVLKPVTCNTEDVKKRNLEGSVSAASMNGELYAYPLTADNGYFMYYNKAYFTETDLATLDGMLSVAEENGKQISMEASSGWYLYSFYGNTGLEVGLNSDGISNYCNWNAADTAVKGTDVAEALINIGSRAGFVSGGDDVLIDGAKNGTIIAGVSGVWNASKLREIWGNNYCATKLPTYTVAGQQIQMSSYVGYKLVGVNSYSDHRYWAEAFAEYVSNEENQLLRFKTRAQGPSNINAANYSEVGEEPAIQALIKQSEYSSLQRIGGKYWSPAADLGSTMLAGGPEGVSLQDYLDGIVAEITEAN